MLVLTEAGKQLEKNVLWAVAASQTQPWSLHRSDGTKMTITDLDRMRLLPEQQQRQWIYFVFGLTTDNSMESECTWSTTEWTALCIETTSKTG